VNEAFFAVQPRSFWKLDDNIRAFLDFVVAKFGPLPRVLFSLIS